MTEETQVARLDRSRPPLGVWADEAIWNGSGQPPADGEHYSWGFDFEEGTGFYKTLEAAIAAAWAHYEEHNDPPGMAVRPWGARGWVAGYPFLWEPTPGPKTTLFDDEGQPWDTQLAARAAAWAWYWRRVAVAVALKERRATRIALGLTMEKIWPRCLAWSDEQVAEVERWLAEGGEVPEVLRE